MTQLTVKAKDLLPGDTLLDSSNEPVKGDFGSFFCCLGSREVTIERDEQQQAVETYEIPKYRMDHLRSKVKRYRRRAEKLGLEPFVLVEEEPVQRPIYAPEKLRQAKWIIGYQLVVPVQLIGNAPILSGWQFVAKIEHTEAGNIISCAPSYHDRNVVPNEMRDGKPTCDHCHTSRRRKETFVVCKIGDELATPLEELNGIGSTPLATEVYKDGMLKRVGRSCLKDFCGTKDAAAAVAIWSLLEDVKLASDPDSDWGDCGSWAIHPETTHYIACAFRAVRTLGWVSSKGTFFGGPRPTKDEASFAATPLSPLVQDEKEKAAWKEAQPTDLDKREAADAVAWAKSLDGSNDYQHNLKVAVSIDFAEHKRYGLLASLVVAYRRHLDQEIERARVKKLGEGSNHFGKVGRRYVRKVTLQKYFQWEDRYSFELRCVHTFEDEDGNLLKWFGYPRTIYLPAPDPEPGLTEQQRRHHELTANGKELEIGDSCWLSFTVKRHGEYKDTKDTTIYRCRTASGPDVYKWLGPDGEIFKTKKEMKAA